MGSSVETLLAVTDAIEHFSLWRIDSFFVEFEGTAWIHDPVVMAVADKQRTCDTIGSAFQCKFFDFFSCFLQVFGAHEPS